MAAPRVRLAAAGQAVTWEAALQSPLAPTREARAVALRAAPPRAARATGVEPRTARAPPVMRRVLRANKTEVPLGTPTAIAAGTADAANLRSARASHHEPSGLRKTDGELDRGQPHLGASRSRSPEQARHRNRRDRRQAVVQHTTDAAPLQPPAAARKEIDPEPRASLRKRLERPLPSPQQPVDVLLFPRQGAGKLLEGAFAALELGWVQQHAARDACLGH